MAPFPVPATHWHVSGPRRLPIDRLTKAAARALLRDDLLADHAAIATRGNGADSEYLQALAWLDAGWDTARVGRLQYVAFACACPQPSPDRR
jgi:hypothetical protein